MPYFSDPVKLKEFSSFEEGVKTIEKNLSAKKGNTKLEKEAVEALRNHVQHASLPITAISFPMSAVSRNPDGPPPGAPTKISFKVTPFIGIQELEDNKDFKRPVLEELRTISNKKNEIDCIVDKIEPIAIEIKSGKTFTKDFLKMRKYWQNISAIENNDFSLIYGGDESFSFQGTNIYSWK